MLLNSLPDVRGIWRHVAQKSIYLREVLSEIHAFTLQS